MGSKLRALRDGRGLAQARPQGAALDYTPISEHSQVNMQLDYENNSDVLF
jgi:hypothetical protein